MTPVRDAAADDRSSSFAIAALLLALIAGFALLPRFFAPREAPMSGKDAPDIALKLVANAPPEGADFSVAALKGRPVLLDFWATWCMPCRQESPIVDTIAQRYREQGLAVVGVNTSDEPGNAAPFAKTNRISYPIAYDEGQRAAMAYGVQNLPTLVLISRTGKVVAIRTGVTSDAELDALVKRVL